MIEDVRINRKKKKRSKYTEYGHMLVNYINLPLFSHSSMFHFTMYNSFALITCYVPNFSFVSHMLFTLKSQISNKGKTIQVFFFLN